MLDRFPKLKPVIAHGSGFLPFYAGRMDRNFENLPQETANFDRKPSEYMRRFYYNSAGYNLDMREFLNENVGATQNFLGGDYLIGEDDPVAFFNGSRRLSAKPGRMIPGENAARVLGLPA